MPAPPHPTANPLDPARSAVVEACAGSGKTWLLVARILRLLLAGVAPGAILAITFTRKAAREIEERVLDGLRHLAMASDEEAAAFLAERGAASDEAARRAARGLYERVLTARPALTVNTFHGWFLRLIGAAPLSAGLAGTALVEFDSRLFDDLWQSFAAECARQPESETTRAFVGLLDAAGLEGARRLMRRAHARRADWLALGEAAGVQGDALARHLAGRLRAELGAGAPGDALAAFFAPGWEDDVRAYLGLLETSEKESDQTAARALRAALDSAANRDNEAAFESIRAALFTEKNTLRVVKAGQKTLDRRYTPPGAARFLELHARLGERAAACAEGRLAEAIAAFNDSAYAVFAGFLAHVEAWQRARRQMDFDDAEWQVLRLLRAPETAAFVQARLDARYKHVLLDEFQDTNPLQWRILRAWFDAYSDDERPRVFLVGDPKQSIYRFRRAEPRLFTVAAEFLEREFGAAYSAQNATRRNAPAIVEVVNALFADEPEFLPAPQTSLAAGLPGRVELLPLFARKAAQKSAAREGLRDPLTEPDVEPEDSRRDDEACALAQKIAEIAGRDGPAWRIEADGGRPAKYGDIMLLARSRTHLSCVERALAAADIPFDAASRGGLLDALEARDVVALLEFLAAPLDGLKLAQALRSPIFACGDADLLTLAGAVAESGRSGGAAWWPALAELAAAGRAGPRLARAARLLSEWRLAAARLPAHDLIDRIYHEGEVLARYRRAAPPAAAPGVEANLRALPLLALELDGGRYPSLPRFIGHLRDLRAAEANDAPGEGRIESGGGAGRVRILTIHGAKGLEAPIVWLLGANEPPRREEPWDALIDWPAEADAPRHFSFVGRRDERGAARQKYFDEEARRARREESNLLYVALTRARQVFIASGIEYDNRKTKADTPYRRLEAALERLGRLGVHGDELPTIAPPAADESSAKKTPGAPAPLPAVGEIRPEAEAGERFGVLLHALLERRTQGSESENWWKPLGFTDAEYARARPAADRLLAAAHLRRFFDPAQYLRARNEAEIAIDGRVRRIDRLVEFADEIWVLDYKSSTPDTPRLPEYQSQLAAYRRAAAATTPKPVHAALLFSGGELVELNGDGLTTESTEGTEKGKNKNL